MGRISRSTKRTLPATAAGLADLAARRHAKAARALLEAAEAGEAGRVRALLAFMTLPNRDNDDNQFGSALIGAARAGHTNCEAALLDAGACLDDACYVAAKHGHVECSRLLLNALASRGSSCSHGDLLLVAAIPGHVECIEALLAAGFDPNLRDSDCRTALDLVLGWDCIEHESPLPKDRALACRTALMPAGPRILPHHRRLPIPEGPSDHRLPGPHPAADGRARLPPHAAAGCARLRARLLLRRQCVTMLCRRCRLRAAGLVTRTVHGSAKLAPEGFQASTGLLYYWCS